MGLLQTQYIGPLENGPDGWISKSSDSMGNDYGVIKTEWKLTLNDGYGSFEVNTMMVETNQLPCIKEATNAKNIYPQEHEAEVQGRKKT